ncbi:het domain protein [Colletotrichum plurivorum]|uniref:Het domain protein n=1 Tax=Colletotrichum plurivorum TaxID=2175906 RepID=A0A8H6K7M9_9PEZI|nr:het domain protein [Colletotrichum plurivorum]
MVAGRTTCIASIVSISRRYFTNYISPAHSPIPDMRLLNATTLRIETVFPGKEPPYAILSHRWTDDEVLLGDIQSGKARSKASFAKLKGCCDVALGQGLSHVWIDTCCIDQNSSAELSEAINSMFRWYRGAQVCYAYLFDAGGAHDYLASQWFDRGWTLQELIAPKEVEFYAKDWTQFGDRARLSSSLSARTGIAEEYLQGSNIWNAPIAERMSWAARRETTRPEDIAYCLLGIFNIHMPLLYGEGGENAFIRLQREVINSLNSADDSWLAWGAKTAPAAAFPASNSTQDALGGMLVRSPSFFESCHDIILVQRDAATANSLVSMTNAGIHVHLPIVTRNERDYMLLGCHLRSDYWHVIAVPVTKHLDRYYRTGLQTASIEEELWSSARFFEDQQSYAKTVKESILAPHAYTAVEVTGEGAFYAMKLPSAGFRVVEVFPPETWKPRPYVHIHLGAGDSSESAPRRVIRLERCPDPDGSNSPDPHDYLVDLSFKRVDRQQRPVYGPYCRVGRVPRDSPKLQADLSGVPLGRAVFVPGMPTLLTAEVALRPVYGRQAYVVHVFTAEEHSIRKAYRKIEDEPEWVEWTKPRRERERQDETDSVLLGAIIPFLFFVMFLALYWSLAPPADNAGEGEEASNQIEGMGRLI